jgi:predicted nuclease with TOPRIM domain
VVDRIERLEAQLKKSASRIEALEAAGMKASNSRRRIANLKAKYSAARERLNELKDAGNENWELHKADIWIAWNELENAFRDILKMAMTEKRN